MAGKITGGTKRSPIRSKLIAFFWKAENQNRNVTKQELANTIEAPMDQVSNSMNGILNAPHYDDFAKHLTVVATGKVWRYENPVKPDVEDVKPDVQAVKPGLEELVIKPASNEDLALLGYRREARPLSVPQIRQDMRERFVNQFEAALMARTFRIIDVKIEKSPNGEMIGARVILKDSDGNYWSGRQIQIEA